MPLFTYAITLESMTGQPRTTRGRTTGTLKGALRSATDAAKLAFPGARWDSLVVVLEKSEK